MISGLVSSNGTPTIQLSIVDQAWPAIIDTGFNGDLELPSSLFPLMNARYLSRSLSILAGGQSIFEDLYIVEFPFDGQTYLAEATFVAGGEILIGTHLLRNHRLEIDFPHQTVCLERPS